MSEHIEFTPNGLLIHKWNAKQKKYVVKIPKKRTICTHLRSRCIISEGTTLGQIFEEVSKYKLLKLVIAQYSWCRSIDQFHEQALEKGHPKGFAPLSYLEIYHNTKTNTAFKKVKHPGGLREKTITIDYESYIEFHGMGPPEEDSQIKSDLISYSVSYSPMWELANLPVRLNNEINVFEPWNNKIHNKENPPEKILSRTKEFTLLEVLDAIYWDISFMGSPQDNADFIDEMKNRLKNFDDSLEDGEENGRK